MPDSKMCPKCNGTLIKSSAPMGLVLVRNEGTEFEPQFVIASQRTGAIFYPYLCRSCGFIELYAPAGTVLNSIDISPDQKN
jgi:hypothetical protein